MKIVERTSDRLVIRHTPWFVGGFMWLMGGAALYAAVFGADDLDDPLERLLVAALGAGVSAIAWWFAPLIEVAFDRRAGAVAFTETRILRRDVRRFPLSREIRVAQQAEHDEGARLTRLALRTPGGVVPLERGFGSADRNAVEAEINRWLDGEAPDPAPPDAGGPAVRRNR